jgi:hypothetical protein
LNTYTHTTEQLQATLQLALHATVDKLIADSLLTREDGDKFLERNIPVILTRQSLWGKLRDRLFPKEDDGGKKTIIVRVVDIGET